MGILIDEAERKAVVRLMKDYNKDIYKQIDRVHKIEKELEDGDITKSRLKDLILATRLISKDLDYKSYPARETVSENIEKIYKATFNTKEKQLKQAVVELKRCSKLIQEYHIIYIQQPWGSVKHRRRCKEQGKGRDLIIERLLDIKQQLKLKQIEFKLVKGRQALLEEQAYLIGAAKEISNVIEKDISLGLREVLSNLNMLVFPLQINKKNEDKEVLRQSYKYLYENIENIMKERG